jgi:hypothetical protein
LHYGIKSSVDNATTWTAAPGAAMQGYQANWYSYTVDVVQGTPLLFTPNDCGGSWDNNGGLNYQSDEGIWNLTAGTLSAGLPTITVENIAPVAQITPASQEVAVGTVVTLSAAGSTDADGTIDSYLWSTGETTSTIDVTVNADITVGVTVTDNQGASDNIEVALTVPASKILSNFAQMHFRGTANGWVATPMTLVSDNTWQVTVNFDGQAEQRFKFDVTGDWSENYGDDGSDGTLEQTGADIYTTVTGDYVITVNDQSMSYTVVGL